MCASILTNASHIGTKEWHRGKPFGNCRLCSYLLELSPLVLSWQAGKKAVRAVLWVSADGLRVVDDKTKVISCFNL